MKLLLCSSLFKQFHKRPGLASALPTPLRVPLARAFVDHFFPDAFGLEMISTSSRAAPFPPSVLVV